MWRKSSHSDNGGDGNCVEVALTSSTALVRDSKNHAATITAPSWAAFVKAVKRDELGQV
ncbi:DUF397 domain-containing protein [Lentzea sp. NPDC060358]|uniref:DUF397 domain-containing protein n=1 Tax=Lentzea sp. NPDC060358 TaxID=3347103 RepID=UPI0036470559